MKTRQFILGSMTWLGLGLLLAVSIQSPFAGQPRALADVLVGTLQWVTGAPEEHDAESPMPLVMAPGDPIFLQLPDGEYRQVGRVRHHYADDLVPSFSRRARIVLYDTMVRSAFPDGFVLEYHTTPTALDWVARTMITPEKQKEIARIMANDWKQHREEIIERLQPVFETSLITAISAIEAELPVVMNEHRSDFATLAERYQAEILRKSFVPLVREQILPIVQEEVRPLAMDLGRDLWDRVSLWSFTWRYLYDVSPLPERNAVKLEFDRFIQQEVTPALAERSEEFVTVTERIVRRISRDEKVRSVVRENLRKVATDAQFQRIIRDVVQEAFINNQTLRASLRDYWASPEVRDALEVASSRFEPTAREIGNSLFGTREGGITPEFSRVLRAQILMKDRRWFVVVPRSGHQETPPPLNSGTLMMRWAHRSMPYPLEFEGIGQSPLTDLTAEELPAPSP